MSDDLVPNIQLLADQSLLQVLAVEHERPVQHRIVDAHPFNLIEKFARQLQYLIIFFFRFIFGQTTQRTQKQINLLIPRLGPHQYFVGLMLDFVHFLASDQVFNESFCFLLVYLGFGDRVESLQVVLIFDSLFVSFLQSFEVVLKHERYH